MADSGVDTSSATSSSLGLPSWILLFVFAVVPAVFATGFSQFEVVKEAVLVGGVGAALLAWVVGLVRRGGVSMVAGRVLVLGLLGGIYAAFSAGWSPSLVYGGVSATHIVALVGIVLVVSSPLDRPIRFVEFATAVAVGTGLAAATGLLDLAGLQVFARVWDPPGETGAFDAMEFAVAYYAVALPIVVAGTDYSGGWERVGFGSAAVLGAIHFGLVANWTYVGVFAGVCLVVALLIVVFEGIETITVLGPLGVMVGFVILINFVAASLLAGPSEPTDATALPLYESPPGVHAGAVDDAQIRNPAFSIDRLESVRSMETRGYLASVAFDLFQDRPIFGHGAGAWWRLQTMKPNVDHPAVERRFTHYPAYRSPHNTLSKLAVEYGAFGLALFALWLIGCATIALGALGRSGEHPDLVIEQWGLWAAALAGAAFGLLTPLVELAPAAAVWVGSMALLTRRSAEVNAYKGASMRWRIGGDDTAGWATRATSAGLVGIVGLGMVVAIGFETASRLHRGWGDQLMLRTYYERAVDHYRKADSWMPIHGGVVYNIALAKTRLGTIGDNPADDGRTRTDGSSDRSASEGTRPAPSGDAGAGSGSPDAGGSTPDAGENPGRGADDSPEAGSRARKGGDKPPIARRMDSSGHTLLKRAVDMRPYDGRALTLLAEFYVRSSFPKKGLEYARRAISVAPNSIPARKVLATTLQSLARPNEAAKQLLAALDRNPPREHRYILHFHLGRMYFSALEEPGNAKEHLKAALNAAPNRAARKRVQKTLKEVKQKIKQQRRMREGKLPKDAPKPPKPPNVPNKGGDQNEGD